MSIPASTHIVDIVQPDITLLLDDTGVIQDATLFNALSQEGIEAWIGRPWAETVGHPGIDQVRRMIRDSRASGALAIGRVTQRFPSGLELPMEYTAARLQRRAGLIALGRNLLAVAELQSRLVSARQTREQDNWKLRNIGTRYRQLFEASSRPVLVIDANDLRVIEANPAAIRAVGLSLGQDFLSYLPGHERKPFRSMLMRVRDQGKRSGLLVHPGPGHNPCFLRASLVSSESEPVFLLQIVERATVPFAAARANAISTDRLIERLPDSFIVLDDDGIVRWTNHAFLDLIQAGAEETVLGARLGRWLSRPGADAAVLLASLRKHGSVRLFRTTIHGEHGRESEVEISAVGDAAHGSRHIGVLLRDVGRRLVTPHDGHWLGAAPQSAPTSLRDLVRDAVSMVERQSIEAALERAGGNRTAAAELLGVSRQSLYEKLDRYGFDRSNSDARTPPALD